MSNCFRASVIAFTFMVVLVISLLTLPQNAQAAVRSTAAQFSKEDTAKGNVVEIANRSPFSNTETILPTYWLPPENSYRLSVVADGIHGLSYTYLQNAGLPVDSLDPRTFRLFYMGKEAAIQVEGEEDGSFDPGDTIVFYGRSLDSLYFEGRLPDHKYTAANVYWLSYGDTVGKRMAVKNGAFDGTTAGAYRYTDHQEQQRRYETRYPQYSEGPQFSPDDDHWFWYKLQIIGATGRKSQSFNFPIDHLATGNYSATLKVHVVGALDNTHGLFLRLNGTEVFSDTTSWVEYEPFTATVDVPQALLAEGNNSIVIEVANIDDFISEIYIDWVELSYFRTLDAVNDQLTFGGEEGAGPWRYDIANFNNADISIFDVTELHSVHRFVNSSVSGTGPYRAQFGDVVFNRRYLAMARSAWHQPSKIEAVSYPQSIYTPSASAVASLGTGARDLLDSANGADWIVITHRDFWTETLPLAEYRAKKMRVAMVDVQQIYDQFNGGMLSSEAIRDFLAYAHENWTGPSPKYVLLAGGGTNDMRGYLSNSKTTYVPTMIYPADPILGETATDNRLVTFLGDDILPDMYVGRIPAYATEEIRIVVDKTIHYEATPTFNDWNTNVLLISDDLEGGGGNFYEFSDILAHGYADPLNADTSKFLPNPYHATKVYLGQTCDLGNPSFATECRADIAQTINNDGALLVSYVGHAQTKNWAVEKLMDQSLASSLTNYDKLSIFLGMACFEGFFHQAATGTRSLGETYLFNPNGGAVASWSPTGFGVATGHDYLEQGMFLALFQNGETRLGPAMTAGKVNLAENAPLHKYDDLIDTFNLFGDPALIVQAYVAPTAVELAGFSATAEEGGRVSIGWETVTEAEIAGFNILRSQSSDGSFSAINTELIVAKAAGSSSGAVYTFVDEDTLAEDRYWYKLELLMLDGSTTEYGLVVVEARPVGSELFLPIVVRE